MKRTMFLLSALLLLILANVLMMSYASPVFVPTGEGFASFVEKFQDKKEEDVSGNEMEGFGDYSGSAAGAKNAYQPMGPFDGVRLSTGNNVSTWRYTKPDEPLSGNYPKFEVGPDNLFMFRDNQAKPECCGSSYSSDMGCICTTPQQRDMIQTRGGNRTPPDAGV